MLKYLTIIMTIIMMNIPGNPWCFMKILIKNLKHIVIILNDA